MSFIAMNRFKVRLGSEEDFETIWKERESRLNQMNGFQEFRMLKGPAQDDHVLYASHVIWETREDFEAWTSSDQFKASHKPSGDNKGARSAMSALMGPPSFEGFETVLFQS